MKKKLEKHKLNVSETVRELLEKYLEDLETRDLEEKLDKLQAEFCGKIDPQLVAQLIREDREQR